MFNDTSLWLMLGSMASTAGLLGFWFDHSSPAADDWEVSRPD